MCVCVCSKRPEIAALKKARDSKYVNITNYLAGRRALRNLFRFPFLGLYNKVIGEESYLLWVLRSLCRVQGLGFRAIWVPSLECFVCFKTLPKNYSPP